jgi:hypothetical protein
MFGRSNVFTFLAVIGAATSARYIPADDTSVGPDPTTLARQASLAAKSDLRSGSGIADFEHYVRADGQSKFELRTKATCTIRFDRGKYFLRMDYKIDADHRNCESRIMVFDGKTLIVNEMSKNIHPMGAWGMINDISPQGHMPIRYGFPFDPSRLYFFVFDSDASLSQKKLPVKVVMLPSKEIHLAYSLTDKVRCEADLLPQFGYNPARSAAWNSEVSKTDPVDEKTAEWAQSDGVWYVKSLDEREIYEGGRKTHTVFKYTEFSPNAQIPASQFELKALELKKGELIMDQRPDAPVRSYKYQENDTTTQKSLDGLAKQIEQMPIHAP